MYRKHKEKLKSVSVIAEFFYLKCVCRHFEPAHLVENKREKLAYAFFTRDGALQKIQPVKFVCGNSKRVLVLFPSLLSLLYFYP